MKPIYKPTGKAKEYGEYAINIYTGCPHRCFYCFAPGVLRKSKEDFHTIVKPRENIVEETEKQIIREKITGKTIHLCFTCDPYPTGYDTTATMEIIKILKKAGNHVQILTKGDGQRDFDLLDENDWFGVTIDGSRGKDYLKYQIKKANNLGIKTWVSFEPVLDETEVLKSIEELSNFVDKVKIGKLNYYHSEINWSEFGHKAERLCKSLGLAYYIKESLRKEMVGDKK